MARVAPTRKRIAERTALAARPRRAARQDEWERLDRRAERAYRRRIASFAATLCVLILVVGGLAMRRERAAVSIAYPARPTTVAAPAPRCADGTDRVAVVAQSPHGSGAALDSPIVVTFSCPVDHRAVERAFVLYPVTAGSFTWEGETLTFHPAEPLLPLTPYRVTLFDGLSDSRGFVNGRKASWPFLTRADPDRGNAATPISRTPPAGTALIAATFDLGQPCLQDEDLLAAFRNVARHPEPGRRALGDNIIAGIVARASPATSLAEQRMALIFRRNCTLHALSSPNHPSLAIYFMLRGGR